jgi:hypothetical protein
LIPTLAATQTATTVATLAPVTYNDQNSAFAYPSNWTTVTDSRAYDGEFKQTKVTGSSVTFTFTGQSFTIIYKAGSLYGKMDVYVDGILITTLNEYSSSTVNQKRWNYGGTLTVGTHRLKLVFVGPTSRRISLDGISVP